jgi:hypothetical protein
MDEGIVGAQGAADKANGGQKVKMASKTAQDVDYILSRVNMVNDRGIEEEVERRRAVRLAEHVGRTGGYMS